MNPLQEQHGQRLIFGTRRTHASIGCFLCAYTQPVPDVLGQCCSKPGEFRLTPRTRCRPKRFRQAKVPLWIPAACKTFKDFKGLQGCVGASCPSEKLAESEGRGFVQACLRRSWAREQNVGSQVRDAEDGTNPQPDCSHHVHVPLRKVSSGIRWFPAPQEAEQNTRGPSKLKRQVHVAACTGSEFTFTRPGHQHYTRIRSCRPSWNLQLARDTPAATTLEH